jgi:hypothetical protein
MSRKTRPRATAAMSCAHYIHDTIKRKKEEGDKEEIKRSHMHRQ